MVGWTHYFDGRNCKLFLKKARASTPFPFHILRSYCNSLTAFVAGEKATTESKTETMGVAVHQWNFIYKIRGWAEFVLRAVGMPSWLWPHAPHCCQHIINIWLYWWSSLLLLCIKIAVTRKGSGIRHKPQILESSDSPTLLCSRIYGAC